MEDNIFGHTREQLVGMFEAYAEYQEMVNEETSKYGLGILCSSAEYYKNFCLWIQNKIMDSKMSKMDKTAVCDMISGLIDLLFKSGMVYDVKITGGLKEYALDTATEKIEEHLKTDKAGKENYMRFVGV